MEKLVLLSHGSQRDKENRFTRWTTLSALKKEETILVAAHWNSLRGIVKILKNISDENKFSKRLFSWGS